MDDRVSLHSTPLILKGNLKELTYRELSRCRPEKILTYGRPSNMK